MAFELLRRVWSQGYATEASRAVLEWARSSGYERVWATVLDWNTAWGRVLAKLGFTARDGLGQLTAAWTPQDGRCDQATADSAALGGPAPYRLSLKRPRFSAAPMRVAALG